MHLDPVTDETAATSPLNDDGMRVLMAFIAGTSATAFPAAVNAAAVSPRAIAASKRGNVAMMFALSLVKRVTRSPVRWRSKNGIDRRCT